MLIAKTRWTTTKRTILQILLTRNHACLFHSRERARERVALLVHCHWRKCHLYAKDILQPTHRRTQTGLFVYSMKRSNHSLRATGASALFTAGVPEKIIKGITGHRSSKALEVYERPTQSQLQAVSSVMSQPGCSFSEELHSRSEVYEHKKEMTTSGAGLLGSMFSGLNECSIQIAPQSMVVNIMQSPQSQSTGK